MLVRSPDPKVHTLDDYDFLFTNGAFLPLSIDKAAGDSVDFDFNPTAIVIKLASKPSTTDPSILLPPEEITIFQSHILTIQHRTREVQDLTPEQQIEWMKTLQEIGGVVN